MELRSYSGTRCDTENQHSGNFTCNESSVLQGVLLMQYFS